MRFRRPEVEVDVRSSFSKFDFVSPVSICDDNYSSEEELKEIINCERQRKKSGASLSGVVHLTREGTDSDLVVEGTRTAPSSRSSAGSSLGIEEPVQPRSGSGGIGIQSAAPAEKRKWSEMSGCRFCASDAERPISTGPCSCDEVYIRLKLLF